MGDLEERSYARMSEPAASYAFHTYPSGVSLVNLCWLVEVIQQYEASGQKLADFPAEHDRLTFMRTITEHVDDDVLVAYLRKS